MLKPEEECTEKERLSSDLFVLYSFLRRGSREEGVELLYLASSDKMCENVSKVCQGRLKLFSKGSITLHGEWSSPGTGFLRGSQCPMPVSVSQVFEICP